MRIERMSWLALSIVWSARLGDGAIPGPHVLHMLVPGAGMLLTLARFRPRTDPRR
jgi:hypothetical protein